MANCATCKYAKIQQATQPITKTINIVMASITIDLALSLDKFASRKKICIWS